MSMTGVMRTIGIIPVLGFGDGKPLINSPAFTLVYVFKKHNAAAEQAQRVEALERAAAEQARPAWPGQPGPAWRGAPFLKAPPASINGQVYVAKIAQASRDDGFGDRPPRLCWVAITAPD